MSAAPPAATSPLEVFASGTVIPAHLLALTAQRRLDERRQRALTRYYLDSGAGGLAVGVHTTQFGIRAAGMYPAVLELAAETATDWTDRPIAMIAGVIGDTAQAVREATIARDLGYCAALLSVAAWNGKAEHEIIRHAKEVAAIMPLIGFALLPEVGGFHLSAAFWRDFAAIEGVIGIKMAPFNRYRTLDIVRGVVEANAEHRVTLYTGNDDHIVLDLLQPFVMPRETERVKVRVKGGLLGHWAVWTTRAVEHFNRIRQLPAEAPVPPQLLALDCAVTDANAAIYDARNQFAGCIPGCHEVLRRQGLFEGTWCLDEHEQLSPGQLAEIDRVYRLYPELNDDAEVAAGRDRWLA